MNNKKSQPKKSWKKFIDNTNSELCNDEALDLLDQMLVYDHVKSI